ncbi:hypothetical protein ACNJYD_08575 [Bradyrhizobium sp. DASA03005]|uniref:hypothetical protein n=1 Tax=Bradyrhizobium sp. SPXBL-02 TaxID=3395912 RepID=UPI003F6F73E7
MRTIKGIGCEQAGVPSEAGSRSSGHHLLCRTSVRTTMEGPSEKRQIPVIMLEIPIDEPSRANVVCEAAKAAEARWLIDYPIHTSIAAGFQSALVRGRWAH